MPALQLHSNAFAVPPVQYVPDGQLTQPAVGPALVPAGQYVPEAQLQSPEHDADDSPVLAPYFPAAQSVGTPPMQKCPSGHVTPVEMLAPGPHDVGAHI